MDAHEAVYKAVLALQHADTSSGVGLNDSTTPSPAYIRLIYRLGDSQELGANDYPACAVDVTSRAISPVPPCESFACNVSFVVTAARDPLRAALNTVDGVLSSTRAALDAVMSRIHSVYEGTTMTTFADGDDSGRQWYFAPMFRVDLGTTNSTTDATRQIATYRVYANKGTS